MVAIDTWHDAKWRQTPFAFIQMMAALSPSPYFFLSLSKMYKNPYSHSVKSRMLFKLKHYLLEQKSIYLCKNKKNNKSGDRELKYVFSTGQIRTFSGKKDE